jgi:S-adenosylmethionine:tRNA ribosyltransferase-isomerase
MKTSDFFYELPKELIAQDPLMDRSSSRLLHLNRTSGAVQHTVFSRIADYLLPGDTLVINDTKVIPARLYGKRDVTGGKVEVLLLKRLSDTDWETLVNPGRKMKEGTVVHFGDPDEDGSYPLTGEVVGILEEGNRRIRFTFEGVFEEVLLKLGEMPLPPYIHHRLKDQDRYNTVYAEHNGSAAAPTAGLHFTKELLQEIEAKGIHIAHVTLHVGLGTFRPVKVDDVTQHHMHSEMYIVTPEAASLINETKKSGHRVICVGTTSCRTVESATDENGVIHPGSAWTSIFIYPGYSFRMMDGLITNFHLPESTLIMLVSAFAGKEAIMKAYEEAVRERYRFFSFGDAMIIV